MSSTSPCPTCRSSSAIDDQRWRAPRWTPAHHAGCPCPLRAIGAHTARARSPAPASAAGCRAGLRLPATVETRGGEGLILRRPNSLYVSGRSPDLLKLTPSRRTGLPTASSGSRGRSHGTRARPRPQCRAAGQAGGPLARRAAVPRWDGLQRRAAAPVSHPLPGRDRDQGGDRPLWSVTVRFQGLTDGGRPRFPVFKGIRPAMDQPRD